MISKTPRRGLENHMWPLVLRLLDATELGWPASIAGIRERKIRSEVETTFAGALAHHLMIAIGHPTSHFSSAPFDVARSNLNANPRLKEPLEYYEIAYRRERGTHRRLDDFERNLIRKRILLGEYDKGREDSPILLPGNPFLSSMYLTTSREPSIIDELNQWNRLATEYDVSKNAYDMAKAHLEREIKRSQLSSSQQKVLPPQHIWNEISLYSLRAHPLHDAFKGLNAWWIAFCSRATEQLAIDCQSKGHHLTLRLRGFEHLYHSENASAFRRRASNAHAEERFFKDYQLQPHWFTREDERYGKRENRSWNLPQLKQLLLRQDAIVDQWINKRGGLSNPNHPAHQWKWTQPLRRKLEDAETRLLWLLIRNGGGDEFLVNFHADRLHGQIYYPDHHFVETILRFEAQLIASIPDKQTREFRMGEVREKLQRAFRSLEPQFFSQICQHMPTN